MTERPEEDMSILAFNDEFLKLGKMFTSYDKVRPLNEERAVETINTTSEGFVLLTSIVSQALHDAEIRPGEFLDSVVDTIKDAREVMGKAKKTVSLLDDSFDKLPEDEQIESLFAIDESDFVYLRRQIMSLKRSSVTDPAAKEKLDELMKIHGARFESDRLAIDDGRFPSRNDRIRIPTSNIPIVYMKDEPDNVKQDAITKNSRAMEKVAYALGVLDEGEMWHDFVAREEYKAYFDSHNKKRESIENKFFDDVAPRGELAVETAFPGIQVGVRFDDDYRRLAQMDRRISLPEALLLGYATVNLELIVPTVDLLPLKSGS
ncbi:MAG: hypothetical protein Q7T54_02895 [Candidatus Levybacteria bacterium]|nr:hypothetical protein [Candidatus Levybacteria bacterium]